MLNIKHFFFPTIITRIIVKLLYTFYENAKLKNFMSIFNIYFFDLPQTFEKFNLSDTNFISIIIIKL
jgi:hypothetical protein